MKKLHNITPKLPRLGELPGWRNLISETRISIQPNIIAPFTVRSKRDLNLSPRYPKQVKLPPIANPQTSREFSRESLKPTLVSYKPLDLKPSVSKLLKLQQTLHGSRRSLSSSLASNTIYSQSSQDNSLEKSYSRNSLSLDPDQEIKRILSINSNQLKRSKQLLQEAGSVITGRKNDRVVLKKEAKLKESDDADFKRDFDHPVGFEDTMRVLSEGHSGAMSIENMNFDILRNVERSHEESRYSDYPLVHLRKLHDSLKPAFQLNTQNTLPEKILNKFQYLEEKPANDEEESLGNRSYEYIKTHSMSYRIHNSDESLSESSDIYIGTSSSKTSKKSICRQSLLDLILDTSDNGFEVQKVKDVNGINCVKTQDKATKILSEGEYIESNNIKAHIESTSDVGENEEHGPKNYLFWYPVIFVVVVNIVYLIYLRTNEPGIIREYTKNPLALNFALRSKAFKPSVQTSSKISLKSPKKALKSPKTLSKSPGNISPEHISKSPEVSSTLPKAPGFPKTLNAKKSPSTLRIKKQQKTLKATSPPSSLKFLNVKSPRTGNKSPLAQKKIKKSTKPAVSKPSPPNPQAITDANITITLNNQPIIQETIMQSNLSVASKPNADLIILQPDPLPMQPPASSLLTKSSLGLITPNYNYFRKLYGIHKSPIASFINNFSRSLMFTIQKAAEIDADAKTSLNSEDSLEKAKKQREKRIKLESLLSEESNSKAIVKRNQSLESSRSVDHGAIITSSPRRGSLPRKGKKNETSPEASNISPNEPKVSIKLKSPQKPYVKKTVYPLPTSTIQSYSIINRNKLNESSESLPVDSDSHEDPELSDSDSNSLDLKSHLKYDYIRASAVYEAGLLRTLANSIVIVKKRLSVIDDSLNNHTRIIGKHTNEVLKSSESEINASNEGLISKNDLDFLIEPRIDRLLFFKNEETKFASKVAQEDNEKFIIESQLDHENLKRNEVKKRFLKNPSKGIQDETESLSFLHILPIEQLITDRLKPKLSNNKLSSQKLRLKL